MQSLLHVIYHIHCTSICVQLIPWSWRQSRLLLSHNCSYFWDFFSNSFPPLFFPPSTFLFSVVLYLPSFFDAKDWIQGLSQVSHINHHWTMASNLPIMFITHHGKNQNIAGNNKKFSMTLLEHGKVFESGGIAYDKVLSWSVYALSWERMCAWPEQEASLAVAHAMKRSEQGQDCMYEENMGWWRKLCLGAHTASYPQSQTCSILQSHKVLSTLSYFQSDDSVLLTYMTKWTLQFSQCIRLILKSSY